jgi:alkylhydroperoxidase family enzyme
MTLAPPADLDSKAIENARRAGVSDAALVDAIYVGAGFNVIDRVADALGLRVPGRREFDFGAKILRAVGYRWLSLAWPGDGGIAAESGEQRKAELFERLREAVLHRPGALDPAVRRAIAENRDVPQALAPYVTKVHRHAYKVTDEDVASLRAAGTSEDEIFEATVAAAVGAGTTRLEAALAALSRVRRPGNAPTSLAATA